MNSDDLVFLNRSIVSNCFFVSTVLDLDVGVTDEGRNAPLKWIGRMSTTPKCISLCIQFVKDLSCCLVQTAFFQQIDVAQPLCSAEDLCPGSSPARPWPLFHSSDLYLWFRCAEHLAETLRHFRPRMDRYAGQSCYSHAILRLFQEVFSWNDTWEVMIHFAHRFSLHLSWKASFSSLTGSKQSWKVVSLDLGCKGPLVESSCWRCLWSELVAPTSLDVNLVLS